jgi:hypothetical protein
MSNPFNNSYSLLCFIQGNAVSNIFLEEIVRPKNIMVFIKALATDSRQLASHS